jgi:HK97 family phage major capsid protein
MTLKELQDKRNQLAAEIRTKADAFNANGKAWKDDAERSNWEKVNADYDANLKELETERQKVASAKSVDDQLAGLEAWEKKSVNDGLPMPGLDDTEGRKKIGGDSEEVTEEVCGLALGGWMQAQLGHGLSERHGRAMQRCRIQPWQNQLVFAAPDTRYVRRMQREFLSVHESRAIDHCLESRDLSAITSVKGGALIGTTLLRTLEVNMLAFGGMRQVAEVMVTNTGERMGWPTADDTGNTGEQLGEGGSIGSSVDPLFGGVYWDAYKFSSKPVLVPYEFIEDSPENVPAILGQMLGERLGRITNTKYTTGSGANTAKGIITAAGLGVTAASPTAIAADEIIRLIYSIDPAYLNASGFMCHNNVKLQILLLKDGEGRYMFKFGTEASRLDTLQGYPVTNNQDMASSVATAAKTLLFGQLSKYKIRRVREMRMYRLEERYRDTDQDGFIALVREDGNLLHAGTVPVKYLQQA